MCLYNILVISILILVPCTILITAQSNVARCFQYTWLGPRYNNESVFLNATCQDATKLARGVPCQQPLVASYDGSWPDVEYIWAHHLQQASCILATNDVCATYTYYFNGDVENSTSMCTRATDTDGSAIRNGCYQQRNGSYVTSVCFCRSVPGGVPCNTAAMAADTPILIVFTFVLQLYRYI
ncbi:uncharacterized protein ACR2FA_004506 [Aphomia sociella]